MAINLGLSVSDVVNVSVLLAPTAAQQRNFGSLLVLGDSGIIDTQQRMRAYTTLSSVSSDFGTNAPEFLAAALFFGQTPQPQLLYIGAWARTATHGTLVSSTLSAAQQAVANFSSIANGSLILSVDGAPHTVSSVNLVGISNLNAVASALQAALIGIVNVVWDANNAVFRVTSTSTGTSSAVSFATASGSGTDISSLMGLTQAAGGYTVAGIAAETPAAAAAVAAAQSNAWYGLMFASSTMPADADYVAVAGLIQGMNPVRIFGVTTQEPAALVSGNSTDIGSQLSALGYSRAFVQYSSGSPYACAAIFGIAFTVNFNGANTTITLKFKQEAGVLSETLTETQAQALGAKKINFFVNYNNATAILQEGVMSNGFFFDVVHGTDWLQNNIQTAVYNLLYTSTTKIPQTDAGVTQIVAAITQAIIQAVANGLVAPGVWTGPQVGTLLPGQTLASGYFIYAPPVATQSQAARGARQSPVITAAIKLAGAIHSVNCVLSVNQ